MGWIALSAAAFGAMAILARFAYAAGVDVHGLLLLRFAIATAVLCAVMVLRGRSWPRGRTLVAAVLMGAIGYVGQAFCFFSALEFASAGLVALLLYVYPTLVCLLCAAFPGERITAARAAVLAASFAGVALTLGGGRGSGTGILLGLAAAVFYAVYIVVGARELRHVDALAATTVVCLSAAVVLGAATAFHAPRWPGSAAGWSAVIAIGLACTVLPILAFFAGLKRVGPSRASIVSTLEPVVTVLLAWIVLGETLSFVQLGGGALVLASAARLSSR
ncbi:MAG TPA: DMT family transporter [Usitatibacter sp.]|jgi:drug/metabolite transporter (DMT)-like permease|nr:DMT family transporter [Usitatibacter sp.]